MILHLVFLKYAATVSQDTKDVLMRDLAGLADELDGIEAFCPRANISPETPLTRGMSEMFRIDFRDAATRDAYLANETHKTIGARLLASLGGGTVGIFVCDVAL